MTYSNDTRVSIREEYEKTQIQKTNEKELASRFSSTYFKRMVITALIILSVVLIVMSALTFL